MIAVDRLACGVSARPFHEPAELAEHSEVSLYFRDPDGVRLELIADPLGEMYGAKVL